MKQTVLNYWMVAQRGHGWRSGCLHRTADTLCVLTATVRERRCITQVTKPMMQHRCSSITASITAPASFIMTSEHVCAELTASG